MICRCGHGWADHLDTGKCWCGCPEYRADAGCPVCHQRFYTRGDTLPPHLDLADHTCPGSGLETGVAA